MTKQLRFITLRRSMVAIMLASLLMLPDVAAAETGNSANSAASGARTLVQRIDGTLTDIVGAMAKFFFYDFGTGVPLIVLWLILGATFFTLRMGFINVRAFWHAIQVTSGKYDDPKDKGEVTHFQALTSALSATVGLGNIAGVTIAVAAGGAGAVFWMLVAGFFGMSSKFVECTLAQLYRRVKPDGRVAGGPMQYLSLGLKDLGMPNVGKALGVLFAVACIGACLGAGNMFQANQSFSLIAATVDGATGYDLTAYSWVYGLVLALLVAVVIVGGIKRIGQATSKIVPLMCGIYILASLFIIISHADMVPALLMTIVTHAFTGQAAAGGFLGVLVIGVQRAVFSNEAGIGSAAIAHAAAKTDEPAREGIVALLGPFIDTIVICLMTALVILITGVHTDPALEGVKGAALTSKAFESVIWWFPYLLTGAVFLFAYSTMISWSYYGERCWEHLFGERSTILFKLLFVVCVFVGAVANLGSVLGFSDMMVLCMAFPNIAGAILLSGKVRTVLDDYWQRFGSGGVPAIAPVKPIECDTAGMSSDTMSAQ